MGKPKPEEPPPSKAYLVSFGDTMTALLAFFIVLLSLADEQSGLNLHRGTGSFVKVTNGVGLPGIFSGNESERTFQAQAISPLYLADDLEESAPDPHATGPDEENKLRSIDREQDVFKRFLNELERLTEIDQLPASEGEVVFDIFNQFNREGRLLKKAHLESLKRVLPVLRRERYFVTVVIWADNPGPYAWRKSIEKSVQVIDEINTWARLDRERSKRLVGEGRPWKYSDVRRPIMSLIVRKLEA